MFCIGFASTVKAEDTDITAIANVIYMAPQQEVSAGETATLSICMKNTAPIRGFQFRICLPEGVTVVKNNKGRIQTSLNPDRLDVDDEHTLSVSEQSDGSILLLCGSLYDENLIGNDGEIATIKVKVSNNAMNGSHPILLKNIKLIETDISKYYVTELIESTLNITNGGDVLNDDEFIVQIQGGLDMLFKITDEENKKCQIGNGTGAAISISEPRTVVLPKTANGYAVTAIAANAFAGTFVGTVHIPNTITSIGENAFKDCSYLDAIYSYIGEPFDIPANVFTGISSHASLTIKYGTKEAYLAAQGWNVFSKISDNMAIRNGIRYSLRGANPDKGDPYTAWVKSSKWNEYESDVVIPEVLTFAVESFTVVGIDDGAFEDSYITSVSIPNTIQHIDDRAFYGCNNLTTVVVNIDSPLTIDGSTFSNRANATLYVPSGAKAAYQVADYWKEFKEIIEMTAPSPSIVFADDYVKTICVANWDTNGDGELSESEAAAVTDLNRVFETKNISSFNELQYFTGLTNIGYQEFNHCRNLTSITIPSSVTSIGNEAFRSCNSLISITIPNGVTSIGEWAFWSCINLPSITLPNSITSIGRDAFTNCSELTNITIPNSVTNIGISLFALCNKLSTISVASDNQYFDSRNNCNAIVETSMNRLIAGCKNTIIPNSITSIEREAFYGFDELTSITIPNSVKSIGNDAFYWCNNLTSVVVDIDSPLAITEGTFLNRANATLYVPAGAKPDYQAAYFWSDFKAIKEFPDADVNQDGVVNVVDVVDIARYVVDDPSPSFDKFLADLNGSGGVSVTDAVVLVNEIAGETSWARRSEQFAATDDQLMLIANADNSLSLHLEGDGQYTAFQLDLHLPADVDLTKALLNAQRKQKHQLLYNKVGEGVYRIIGLSTSGRTFLGNAGELLNMQLDDFATEDIMMDNIHFITPAAADVLFEPVMLSTEATGIAAVNKADEADHRVVYNLNGQRITAPRKGLNIVNGKKLIVK